MDASLFEPASPPTPQPGGPGAPPGPPPTVTVVALSRLVYRKGVDLLNVAIPAICHRQPHVDFIIGAP